MGASGILSYSCDWPECTATTEAYFGPKVNAFAFPKGWGVLEGGYVEGTNEVISKILLCVEHVALFRDVQLVVVDED